MIRTLIVDDEELAREAIQEYLDRDAEIEVVQQCSNGKSAIAAIQKINPDLLFLDVQMPSINGFEVLASIDPANLPVTVFVTAYDKYALKAFETHAVDYLLKPFDADRFAKALAHAKTQVLSQKRGDATGQLLKLLTESSTQVERIAVRRKGSVRLINASDIDWVEADDNYVKLHIGKEALVYRETMTAIEKKLNPRKFVRIHRSMIVNMDRIKEMRPWFTGEYIIVLHSGRELTMSRGYRDRLTSILGG